MTPPVHAVPTGLSMDALVLLLSIRAEGVRVRDERRINSLVAGAAWDLGYRLTADQARDVVDIFRRIVRRGRRQEFTA